MKNSKGNKHYFNPYPLHAMLTCRINSVPLASYFSILSTLNLGVRGYKTQSFLLPLDVAIPNPTCKIYSGHRRDP